MQVTQSAKQPEFSVSKFYMWRCVVAMAHADGIVKKEETGYLNAMFANMRARAGMTDEQYNTLVADMKTPQDVGNLLPYINEPAFRSQVVYFARLLAYKDGEFSPPEQKLLDKLNASVLKGVDLEQIRQEVRNNVQREMNLHDIEIDKDRPQKGLFHLLDLLALEFGIDLMRE